MTPNDSSLQPDQPDIEPSSIPIIQPVPNLATDRSAEKDEPIQTRSNEVTCSLAQAKPAETNPFKPADSDGPDHQNKQGKSNLKIGLGISIGFLGAIIGFIIAIVVLVWAIVEFFIMTCNLIKLRPG